MADKKISQLTAATTPLDGTEVLPIVQGTTTKKVANNDLRPKQIQSNATSGVLQVTGPAAASTRVMTTPDDNFTVARTDAGQTFTGNQTVTGTLNVSGGQVGIAATLAAWGNPWKVAQLSGTSAVIGATGQTYVSDNYYIDSSFAERYIVDGAASFYKQTSGGHAWWSAASGTAGAVISTYKTMDLSAAGDLTNLYGNFVVGTSGKGIDFSATASGSGTMTSELLADYEEGTWTPTFYFGGNAVTSYTSRIGTYTKVGNVVYFTAAITFSSISGVSGFPANISSLPFTSNSTSGISFANSILVFNLNAGVTQPIFAGFGSNTNNITLYKFASGTGGLMTDGDFTDTSSITITGSYIV